MIEAWRNKYPGKPILFLVECYILDLLGDLPQETRSELEPHWQPHIRNLLLGFDANIDEKLHEAWKEYVAKHGNDQRTQNAKKFAEAIALNDLGPVLACLTRN